MASVGENPQPQGNAAKPVPKSRHQHGLFTPESTPVPEDAGITADKERSAREAKQKATMDQIIETVEGEESTASQSKPAFDVGSQADSESDSDDSDKEDMPPPSEAQLEAVKHVLACSRKDYRQILKVDPASEDARQDKENVVNSFRKLGCLVHPDHNKSKGAAKALQRVLRAAKKLGVENDDINEVKFWDGEELVELHLTADGKWVDEPDSMEGVENMPDLKPTEVHQRIWREAKSELGRLMENPEEEEEAFTKLQESNARIVEENKARQFPEAMLDNYTIDVKTFKAFFKSAAPFLTRLRKSHADVEARTKFDALNEQLKDFNRLHSYPSDWTMDLPPEEVSKPVVKESTKENLSTPNSTVDKPGYRRCTRRGGYVRENGIEKKIEGSLKVGFGHQMLISYLGNNNLTVYEKAASSTFGKGFGKAYNSRPDAKMITIGKAEELENKRYEDMVIGGVASDRRDPGKEPANGWAQQAKTIVRVGFGKIPATFTWYTRSTLGERFGQVLVDEDIDGYRADAGQEAPLPPTRRASRPRQAPTAGSKTASKAHHLDESPANPVEDPMANLLARFKELEDQIKQLSKTN